MPPPPAVSPVAARTLPWRALGTAGIMVALFLAVLWPKIASGTLWFHDELLSGNRAREILLRHDPLTITINFTPDFKKPPLQYWLEAAFLLASKNREIAIRLPSLLYGALCLPVTVLLAWSVSRRRARGNTGLLVLPAVAVAACGSFVHYSRVGLLDTGIAFYLALALIGCQLARENPRWWFLVGGCCWLGAWQKAPYGFGAWLVVLILRAWREPETAVFRSRHLWGALGLSLALTAGWFGLQFLRHDDALILNAGQEQASALWRGHDPDSTGFEPYKYWWWLIRDWTAVGFLAPVAVVATLVRGRGRGEDSRGLELAGFCAAYGLVLCLIPFRVERYLIAMVPLLAVITLDWAAGVLEGFEIGARTRRLLLGGLVVMSFPVAGFHYLKPPRGGPDSLLKAAHDLRGTLQPGETVLIDNRADPDFNTNGFIVFYADLRQPALVCKNLDAMLPLLMEKKGNAYRGIEHQTVLPRLLRADPTLQIVSRHGEWILWRRAGTGFPP